MNEDGVLHPRRIEETLKVLNTQGLSGGVYVSAIEQETCIAALKLLQKSQKAMGLTANIVDAGAVGLELVKAFTKKIR